MRLEQRRVDLMVMVNEAFFGLIDTLGQAEIPFGVWRKHKTGQDQVVERDTQSL